MPYEIETSYDPYPEESPQETARRRERLERDREIVRGMLPELRREIENPDRDLYSVSQAIKRYRHETFGDVPLTADDVPELEAMCRTILERRGPRQAQIQTVLLHLIGATAAPQSVPFLLDMLHYGRRGDLFGPERRRLALWGLARIALLHGVPEAYEALQEGLEDHHANVRFTATDLILDAYLDAGCEVPRSVAEKLEEMAGSDPDSHVQVRAKRFLREPWAQDRTNE